MIYEEFTKSRGKVSCEESIAITDALVGGKFAITAEQFVEHLKNVIPQPYFVEGLTSTVASKAIMGNRLGLGSQYQIIVKNSSKKDKKGNPENSGFVILFQVDDSNNLLQSICLENGSELTEERVKEWCKFGTELLLLLSSNTTRTEAENAISKMMLDDDSSLYGFGELRAEYASFSYNLLGMLTCTQHCILIRPQE